MVVWWRATNGVTGWPYRPRPYLACAHSLVKRTVQPLVGNLKCRPIGQNRERPPQEAQPLQIDIVHHSLEGGATTLETSDKRRMFGLVLEWVLYIVCCILCMALGFHGAYIINCVFRLIACRFPAYIASLVNKARHGLEAEKQTLCMALSEQQVPLEIASQHRVRVMAGVFTQHVGCLDAYDGPAWSMLDNDVLCKVMERATAGRPERALLLACVCKRWRGAILARPGIVEIITKEAATPDTYEKQQQQQQQQHSQPRWVARSRTGAPIVGGARTCYARLMMEAAVHDRPKMLRWVLNGTRAFTPKQVFDMFAAAARHDSHKCVHISTTPLRTVVCAAGDDAKARCLCNDDPEWHPTTASAIAVASVRPHAANPPDDAKCARIIPYREAAREGRVAMLDRLARSRMCHPVRWAHAAFAAAIDSDNVEVLDTLAQLGVLAYAVGVDSEGRIGRSPSRPANTWLKTAAEKGNLRAMQWLVAQPWFTDQEIDALVPDLAGVGATKAVVWLCERGHLMGYVRAVATAIVRGHHQTARAMAPFARHASILRESMGNTLDEWAAFHIKSRKMTDTQAALLKSIVSY